MDQKYLPLGHYKKWERFFSYVVFLIATTVYIFTMEKSASVWDNPEFITTFYKLEVGHPPGAPFYMLVYNFFANFFPDHGDWVAIAANTLSAIFSGLTILLLFRSIAYLIRRGDGLVSGLTPQTSVSEVPRDRAILYLGGALLGALLYAFTDTFWYSAVEAEVYSFSSFFTALVFYLILKWEERADEESADSWLLLIAYLMGLSVGVHLLNLLAVPAMALIFYFRRVERPTWVGALVAVFISFLLIAVMMYGIIQGAPEVAGYFDLFFVNSLGLPFNSGLAFYVVLLFVALGYTLYASLRRPALDRSLRIGFLLSVVLIGIPFVGNGWVLPLLIIAGLSFYLFGTKRLNLHLLSMSTMALGLFFIGLSTYGVILLRANSDIPMNQNTPSDVYSLRYYLSREQYGSTPKIYGQTYASLPKYDSHGHAITTKEVTYKRAEKSSREEKDRYVRVVSEKIEYRDDMNMLFPRLYSNMMPHFKEGYERWGNIKGKVISVNDRGEQRTIVVPTFFENLRYFLAYQVNYMYWRYFLWNFSGRQNDLQGQGELTKGNWITGIPFIDALFLGSQADLPPMIKENKGHNRYFMLPLILGLIGLLTQAYGSYRNRQNFFVILLFFFMTGIAIVLYINQTPYQVRERDYSYAGSFYAFSIWIGCALPGIYDSIVKGKEGRCRLALGLSLLSLGVPLLVFAQNVDDHNRHGRRIASDFGRNYLESCDEGGIIFCNGDNDTFPLWYMQEVEGVRRDVKVINTSYLQADWYIEQMKRPTYEAAAAPITWGLKEYGGDRRSVVYIFPQLPDTLPVRVALDFAASDDPAHRRIPGIAQEVDYVPVSGLTIEYDAQELIKRGLLYPSDTALVGSEKMLFDFKDKRYLGKQELVILDMLEESDFKRPFYYCLTVGESERLGMTPHFRQTGMAYQVMPFKTKGTGSEVDVERMYRNVTQKFRWGGNDVAGVYMDENNRRISETYRSMVFAPLASALIAKGDTLRAREVLELSEQAIRKDVVPHSASSIPLIGAYYDIGDIAKAEEISVELIEDCLANLKWFFTLRTGLHMGLLTEVGNNLLIAGELLRYNDTYGGGLTKQYGKEINSYLEAHRQFVALLEK